MVQSIRVKVVHFLLAAAVLAILIGAPLAAPAAVEAGDCPGATSGTCP